MKKKVIFLVLTLVFSIMCFNIGKLFKSDVLDSEIKESKPVNDLGSLNTLSMMIETEAGSGEYTMETRSSWPTDGYVFNGELSKCENGSTLLWEDENNVVLFEGTSKDKCYVYFDKLPLKLSDWVKNEYVAQTSGNETIYFHDSSLENGAGDNSYRYAGASEDVNNYVCFGSDEETCPNDNLYRIIGVFDNRVKLIKADYATSEMLGTNTNDYDSVYSENTSYYQGDSSNLTNIAGYHWNKANLNSKENITNDWSYSELNKTHLNINYINYLNNIDEKWINAIDVTEWKVGGFASANLVPSTLYSNEVKNPSTEVESIYTSKIGLMYVSDYGFSAIPSAWTTTLYNYSSNDASGNKITEKNWMYMGLFEWTMIRKSSNAPNSGVFYAYNINDSGAVPTADSFHNDINNFASAIRPVFHLVSSITYVSGDGTKTSPIRIN